MDSKKHLMVIEKREPLGKYEQIVIAEMTWDEATQRASRFLSPTLIPDSDGIAFSVRIAKAGQRHWIYIPQW